MDVDHIFTQGVTTVSVSDEERAAPAKDRHGVLTVDGMIAALVNFREEYGGDLPVFDATRDGMTGVGLAQPDGYIPRRALLF